MSTLSNSEILGTVISLMTEKANQVAFEELKKYEKAHENAYIDQEIRDIVQQRAASDLLLKTCSFKPSPEIDLDTLKGEFENWFLLEEEQNLRQSIVSTITLELKKRYKPGEENLTFTERFLKKVKEQGKQMNTVGLMDSLKDQKP